MTRKTVPDVVQVELLRKSGRRCALCVGLNHDFQIKKGQIAHLDKNNANNDIGNLVWLCLEHHDDYDSKTSQSKGFRKNEIKDYRDSLYTELDRKASEKSENIEVFLDNNIALLFMFALDCKKREDLEFRLKLLDDHKLKEHIREVWDFLQTPVPPDLGKASVTGKDRIELLIDDLTQGEIGKSDAIRLVQLAKTAFENTNSDSREELLSSIQSRSLREMLVFKR